MYFNYTFPCPHAQDRTRAVNSSPPSYDADVAAQLWAESAALCALPP